MHYWLLAAAVRQAIETAYANGVAPTFEQQADYEARYGYESDAAPRILTIAGDTAQIAVSGVLTKAPSFMAMLFGGGNVTYTEIVQALAESEANPKVKSVNMEIDSPGGSIDGLFDAIAAMEAFSKPLTATVVNQAASAAYALAASADSITASNRAARVGSIGIVAGFSIDPTRVEVTSTKAPKKRPDVQTEEGKSAVREEIDALHELFVDAIATGRRVTADKVNAEYGQGATMLADDALKRGMIDAIAGTPLRVVKSARTQTTAKASGTKPETGTMDLNTLKAQHPDVFAAAMQEGVSAERERVTAHLILGEASGSMPVAVAAIKDGTGMTATMSATYSAAGMNRNDQQNRQEDETSASAGDSAASGGEGGDVSDEVCALVEAKFGIAQE